MKLFEISEELATKILNYLASRPYAEVISSEALQNMISELQQIKPISEQLKIEDIDGGDN